MYLRDPGQYPSPDEAADGAIMFGRMFIDNPHITEADGPTEYKHDFYNLAYMFWKVGAFTAGRPLPHEVSRDLAAVIGEAGRQFPLRFPTVFPIRLVRLAFDGLYHLATTPDPYETPIPSSSISKISMRDAHARADWLRNALHNVYLEARHFPPAPGVMKFPKPPQAEPPKPNAKSLALFD